MTSAAPAKPSRASNERPRTTGDDELALSLVRDDVPFRVWQKIGLVPRQGLGTVRRAVFFALFTWLPIAVWALYTGHALPGAPGEPLFVHFSVNVRCLIAIPLLILGQGLAHTVTMRVLPWFLHSGVVTEKDRPRFIEIVRGVERLRKARKPWIVIGALVIAWAAIGPFIQDPDDLNWAQEGAPTASHLGFGGWWHLLVARPVYLALLAAWLWRVILLWILFARIARLDLHLVPTHPDRIGGLGFVERFVAMFSPVVLALSAVLAAYWAHQVLYHAMPLESLYIPAAIFIACVLVIFLAPLLAFAKPLMNAKRVAELQYGALVGTHGELVRRRWILGQTVTRTDILEAPELGPVADTVSLFDAVERMRIFPFGKRALVALLLPAVLPMLFVVAIRIPVGELLIKMLHALG